MSVTPPKSETLPAPEAQKSLDVQKTPESKGEKFHLAESFLQKAGINRDNFDDKFDLAAAIDFVKMQNPADQQLKKMEDINSQLLKWESPKLLNNSNPKVYASNLDKALRDNNITGDKEKKDWEDKIRPVYDTVQFHRDYLDRFLKSQAVTGKILEGHKVDVGTSLTEDISGMVQEVKSTYKKMDGTEKFVVVGGLLLAVGMFLQSDNPNVGRFRDAVINMAKLGGFAYVASKIFKLATGEGPLDALDKATKQKAELPKFWTETFKTDAEKAAILRDSYIYMGDKDFSYLEEKYRVAKKHGENKIDIDSIHKSDMNSKQIFTAMDVFFEKYDKQAVDGKVVNLKDKYANWNPPATWRQVFSNETVSDKTLNFDDSTAGKMADAITGTGRRALNRTEIIFGAGYDWVADKTGAAWNWASKKYHDTMGKDGNEEQVKKFAETMMPQGVINSKEFPDYINRVATSSAVGFAETYNRGTPDAAHSLKFHQDSKSMYIIAEQKIQSFGDPKSRAAAFAEAEKQAKEFLKGKYGKEVGEKIDTVARITPGVFMEDKGTVIVPVRMPLPGTTEFNRYKAGLVEATNGQETLGENEKIDYDKMEPWQQERFRLRFFVDASQKDTDIKKITQFLTEQYRRMGLPKEVAQKRAYDSTLDANNGDFKAAGEKLGYTKKLYVNAPTLEGLEDNISKLEKQAAHDAKNDDKSRLATSEMIQRQFGPKIRLAILGDTEAQNWWLTKVPEFTRSLFDDPAKFVEWYGQKLRNEFVKE